MNVLFFDGVLAREEFVEERGMECRQRKREWSAC
jgi:hypothetical protein